jgi:acetyltransferase-like isoleucine patch superfamily enzyme
MKKLVLSDYKDASIGNNVEVWCEEFSCIGAFTLGDNVSLKARRIVLGNNARIDGNVAVRSLKENMEEFSMGDESLIGFNTQVLVPSFTMGDYTQLFNSSLVSGYKPVTIGHNCWIGQGAILNSAETLILGNNVRMGGSQIWTHVASGELLEGSNFYSEQPVTIEDDVWLMGFGHTIVPGVTLKKKSVIMAGSVVTKSTEENKTYSGIPAIDISDRLPAWQPLTLAEKFEKLKQFTHEFVAEHPEFDGRVFGFDSKDDKQVNEAIRSDIPVLIFFKQLDLGSYNRGIHTIFDLDTKRYTKQRTAIEICWVKFSLGFRARFIPFQ